ncbi:MAG TPA: hypothetical protein PLT92_15065 [Ignavibacteriaceae bacterium]|nr:hypothetical protein [Ignavibacteriaceae bacterium]
MKYTNYILITLILISLAVLTATMTNLFINFRPILDSLYYIEKQNPILIISVTLLISVILTSILIVKLKSRKSRFEKMEMFEMVIHTVQDIMQKSSSRLQNILLDMEEQNVENKLREDVRECLDENIKLINLLSKLNPDEIDNYYDTNLASIVLKTQKTNG